MAASRPSSRSVSLMIQLDRAFQLDLADVIVTFAPDSTGGGGDGRDLQVSRCPPGRLERRVLLGSPGEKLLHGDERRTARRGG